VQCGGNAGQHEDSGADNRPDAQHGEVERPERPLQRSLTGGFGLGTEFRYGLGGP
jgi:hypothetical protein